VSAPPQKGGAFRILYVFLYTTSMPHIIFTTHAKQRMKDRKLSVSQIMETIHHPLSKQHANDQFTFVRKVGAQRITVIAHMNQSKAYVVRSCWIDPPNMGTADEKHRQYWSIYKKASFWGKFVLVLKKQLGFM